MTRSILKKALVWVLLMALVLPLIPAVAHGDDTYGFSEMWIKTDNGKKLAVRAEPNKNAEIIGYAEYGNNVLVDWSYAGNDGWSKLVWGALGDGYVQTRYLVSEKPAPYKSPEQKKAEEEKAEQKKLRAEYLAVNPAVRAMYGPLLHRFAECGEQRIHICLGILCAKADAQRTVYNLIGKPHGHQRVAAPAVTAGGPGGDQHAAAFQKVKQRFAAVTRQRKIEDIGGGICRGV